MDYKQQLVLAGVEDSRADALLVTVNKMIAAGYSNAFDVLLGVVKRNVQPLKDLRLTCEHSCSWESTMSLAQYSTGDTNDRCPNCGGILLVGICQG